MARVTVEDCAKVVPNRFDLVVLAAQRTRQLNTGEPVTISGTEDEKKPVIALREIAAQTVSIDDLKESVINSYRTFIPELDEDDGIDDIVEEDSYDPYASLGIIEDANLDVSNELENEDDQTSEENPMDEDEQDDGEILPDDEE